MRKLAATFLIGLAALLVAPTARAQQTLAYGAAPDMQLDLYQPAGSGPFRLVVFIHGGGWTSGNKATGEHVAPSLVSAGYAVASIDYRKVPEITPQGQIGDTAAAIAYLLHNAAKLRLSPTGIALLGHSSGGHVVTLLGTDQTYLSRAGVDPHVVKAVIALDGVYDVTANVTHFPSATRLEVFGADHTAWRALSPTENLSQMQAHPAFCLLHEDTDRRFIEQAGLFETALSSHGETLRTALAPGLHHPQLVNRFGDPDLPMLPFTLDCLHQFLPLAARH